ncbi:hypothetical protein FQR65_LT02347 [Abscondita terminalis]|nr:hypothetical protein FQR65_LT02347 [Abscondita terminalis]
MLTPINIAAVLLTVLTRYICRTPTSQVLLPRSTRVGRSMSRASLTMGLLSILYHAIRNRHLLWHLKRKICNRVQRMTNVCQTSGLEPLHSNDTLQIEPHCSFNDSVQSGPTWIDTNNKDPVSYLNDNNLTYDFLHDITIHKQKPRDNCKVVKYPLRKARSRKLEELSSNTKRSKRGSTKNKSKKI